MDTQNTSVEEALRTLLARSAATQVGIETLQAATASLQGGLISLQGAVTALQADVAGIKGGMVQYATKAEVEMVRSDLYKAMEAQTWRIVMAMTAVCSALTTAVYFIARNVH